MKELFNTLSNVSQFFREKRFVYGGGGETSKGNTESSEIKTEIQQAKPTAERSDKAVQGTEDAGAEAKAISDQAFREMQKGIDTATRIMKQISKSRETLVKQGAGTEVLLTFDKCVQRTAYKKLAEKALGGKPIDFKAAKLSDWQKAADYLLTAPATASSFILTFTKTYPNKIPNIFNPPKTAAAKKAFPYFLSRADSSLRDALQKNDNTGKEIKKDMAQSKELLVLNNASKEALLVFDKCMKNPSYMKLLARKFKPMHHKMSSPDDWQKAADYLLTNQPAFVLSYTEKFPNKIPNVFNPPKTPAAKKAMSHFVNRSNATLRSVLKENNNTAKEIKAEISRARDLLAMGGSEEALLVFDKCMKNPSYMKLLARKFKPMHYRISTIGDWQQAADYLLTNQPAFMLSYAEKNPKKIPQILEDPQTPLQKSARLALQNWQRQSGAINNA